MEASVLMAKCVKWHRPFGIRVQRMQDGQWWMTWAFKISDRDAHREGYDSTQVSGLYATDEYPGCPHCGSKDIIVCNTCGRVCCAGGVDGWFTCPHCGQSGGIDYVDSLTARGGDY